MVRTSRIAVRASPIVLGFRGAACAAVLLITALGWSPAFGAGHPQAVTPDVQAKLRAMPLEHFPAVYVSKPLSWPESETLTRRFKESKFPG